MNELFWTIYPIHPHRLQHHDCTLFCHRLLQTVLIIPIHEIQETSNVSSNITSNSSGSIRPPKARYVLKVEISTRRLTGPAGNPGRNQSESQISDRKCASNELPSDNADRFQLFTLLWTREFENSVPKPAESDDIVYTLHVWAVKTYQTSPMMILSGLYR